MISRDLREKRTTSTPQILFRIQILPLQKQAFFHCYYFSCGYRYLVHPQRMQWSERFSTTNESATGKVIRSQMEIKLFLCCDWIDNMVFVVG